MKPVAQASRVSYVRALASPENINRVWYPVTLKKRKKEMQSIQGKEMDDDGAHKGKFPKWRAGMRVRKSSRIRTQSSRVWGREPPTAIMLRRRITEIHRESS